MYAATIGATVGVITVILDGVAAKQLADQWVAAAAPAKAAALGLFSANETVNFALGGLFNLSFAGVPYLLFGLAVARAGTYPRWLGWVAFYAGIGSVLAGLIQALRVPRGTSLSLLRGGDRFAMWRAIRHSTGSWRRCSTGSCRTWESGSGAWCAGRSPVRSAMVG
jgi:hypothetical protein